MNFEDFLQEEEQLILKELTKTIIFYLGSNERKIQKVRVFDENLWVDEYLKFLKILKNL